MKTTLSKKGKGKYEDFNFEKFTWQKGDVEVYPPGVDISIKVTAETEKPPVPIDPFAGQTVPDLSNSLVAHNKVLKKGG